MVALKYKDTIVLPVESSENNVKLCRLLTSMPKPYVIVGDLNYSQIDWRTLKTDSSTDDFVGAVQVNFLSQHIDFPTHNSGTQPDVVLSSCESLVLDAERMCHLGASDHSMVMVTVAGSLPSNSTTENVPDWGKADLSKQREEVMSIEWERDMQNMDTLNSWEFVKSRLASAENNCVPKKRRRISNRPLWMQQNVMRTIRRKKRLWATYQKTAYVVDNLVVDVDNLVFAVYFPFVDLLMNSCLFVVFGSSSISYTTTISTYSTTLLLGISIVYKV